MRIQKVDLHDFVVVGDEIPQIAQVPPAAMHGAGGGRFESGGGMRLGQADQALQGAQAVDAALGKEALGPGRRVRADQAAAAQPVLGSAFDATALVRVEVRLAGGEAAGLGARVRADQLHAVRTAFPQAPEQMWVAMQGAADEFVRKTKDTWTADEAIQLWEDLYVTDFTEAELQLVLAAAKTPFGQKQIAAGKRANAGLQGFLVERANKVLEEAATAYIAEIQRIVSEIIEPSK